MIAFIRRAAITLGLAGLASFIMRRRSGGDVPEAIGSWDVIDSSELDSPHGPPVEAGGPTDQ